MPVCLWFQFHAEVYFEQEQQSYMLVDQGSQNGTVINGNRILQVSILFTFELKRKKQTKPELSRYHVNDTFICSPKPSLSLMHWCTAMKWRWERLCCPSISIQGTIPVMAVSPVRWWLTSASTREKTTLVSYLKWNTSTERGISFILFYFLHRFMKQQWACSCCKSCSLSQCEITLLSLPLLFSKGPALTKEDKESLRQKELKQMKAKYGLQVSANLGAVISFNPLVFSFPFL